MIFIKKTYFILLELSSYFSINPTIYIYISNVLNTILDILNFLYFIEAMSNINNYHRN